MDRLGNAASGVFVIDETGFMKKGVRSAGVQRQYTGSTGKIDNCQLGVFLAYASSKGRALIDRELYLPTSWNEDPQRCAAAGIPEGTGFATKPQQGLAMLARAVEAGALTSGSWVTADEAYGQNPTFRTWLGEHQVPFVLATRNDDVMTSPDRHRRQAEVLATLAGAALAGTAQGGGWERRSIGPGAHGERIYNWTAVALDPTGLPPQWGHWLLVRRQTEPAPGKRTRDLAFYRCAGPTRTPLRDLIRVAGARWVIEDCFKTAKNEAGLDHYQVRSWRAWHAPITPGHARRRLPRRHPRPRGRKGGPAPGRNGLIPLSGNEIRRLLAAPALEPVTCFASAPNWSNWRRRRQHQARTCHYRRRNQRPPT